MVTAALQLAQTSEPALSSSSTVPIGVAVVCTLFVVGVVMRVNNKLTTVENSIKALTHGMRETWSRKDQEIYSLKLKIQNPNIDVPDVQAVGVKPESHK